MKLLTIILALGFLFHPQDSVATDQKGTKGKMRQILDTFVGLIPYMTRIEEFKNPKNEDKIYSKMSNLSLQFKKMHKDKKLNAPGFSPSYKSMKVHLDETIDTFQGKHKDFALSRLRASTQLCMNCHGGLPDNHRFSAKAIVSGVTSDQFKNQYDYAEFLYLTRQYDKAVIRYMGAIDEQIENKKKIKNIDKKTVVQNPYMDQLAFKSLKKILTTYTKPKIRLERASTLLEKYSNNSYLSKFTKDQINEWIKQLASWQKENPNFKEPKDTKTLKDFITNNLKDTANNEIVKLLVGNGVLTRYLNQRPKSKHAPEIIYWMAKTEREINNNIFFSLSDIFLKECIENYSDHPYAEKCYDQYKENITMGYTGSSGTDIPKDEKEELKRLHNILIKSR